MRTFIYKICNDKRFPSSLTDVDYSNVFINTLSKRFIELVKFHFPDKSFNIKSLEPLHMSVFCIETNEEKIYKYPNVEIGEQLLLTPLK